jgi:tetratricopeptide (TPR) repeat protein
VRDFEGALRTARSIDPDQVPGAFADSLVFQRGQAFVEIATAQAKAGDQAGATSTLHELSKLIEEREDKVHRLSLLYKIAGAQQEMGDFKAALQTVEALPKGLRVHLLLQIAKAQRKSGQPDAAGTTFQKALQDAEFRLEHGLKPDANHSRSKPVGQPEKSYALADISEIRAAMGDFKGALQAAETITDKMIEESLYRNISQSMIEAGDIQGALEWAKGLTDPDLRAHALKGVAFGLARFKSGELRLPAPADPPKP